MSYEIKIGQRSIAITDNVSEVVAPNEQMAILFKGMANIFGDLRAVAMLAEAEADAVEVIRNDPDLNEAAKNRRARDAANRDTLTAFTRSTAMISEQAENILNYLKTKLAQLLRWPRVMLSDLCEIVSYGMYFARWMELRKKS